MTNISRYLAIDSRFMLISAAISLMHMPFGLDFKTLSIREKMS